MIKPMPINISFSGIGRVANAIREDFLPIHCLLCNSACDRPNRLCDKCDDDIRINIWPCPCCAAPGQVLVAHCAATTAPCKVHAGLEYGGVVRELIHRWKFNRAADLTGFLVRRALTTVPRIAGFDAMVPVPMHWRKRWYRGYNQSEVLARVLSRELQLQSGIRVPVKNLLRAKGRPTAQHLMNRRQRHQSVEDRYTACAPLKGQSILVVDDVLTTGQTIRAVAQCIAGAGATRVEAWCLARAPLAANKGKAHPR